MPLPPNDPRRRKPPTTQPPTPGNKPGTGFVPVRTVTFRGGRINMSAFPSSLEGKHLGEADATPEEMTAWIPEYLQGHNWKNVDQWLEGLWQARAIPGLTPEQHAEFDGRTTIKEFYLLVFTQDGRLYKAWQKLNGH